MCSVIGGAKLACEQSGQGLHLVATPAVGLGREALMRWQRRPDALIMPNDFMGVAEGSGLIVDMGAWAVPVSYTHLTLPTSDLV